MTATTELFAILGQVGSPVFPIWIARHAARLGLGGRVLSQAEGKIELRVNGPPELLDAMALACSLGPQEVWVDRIDRVPANAAMGQDSVSVPA